MKDVVVLLMILGFFGICVAYVGLCDRIVGPDEPENGDAGTGDGGTAGDAVVAAGGGATEVDR